MRVQKLCRPLHGNNPLIEVSHNLIGLANYLLLPIWILLELCLATHLSESLGSTLANINRHRGESPLLPCHATGQAVAASGGSED